MSLAQRRSRVRRVPQKCRLQARSEFGLCFEAEPGYVAAEARCLQKACSLETARRMVDESLGRALQLERSQPGGPSARSRPSTCSSP